MERSILRWFRGDWRTRRGEKEKTGNLEEQWTNMVLLALIDIVAVSPSRESRRKRVTHASDLSSVLRLKSHGNSRDVETGHAIKVSQNAAARTLDLRLDKDCNNQRQASAGNSRRKCRYHETCTVSMLSVLLCRVCRLIILSGLIACHSQCSWAHFDPSLHSLHYINPRIGSRRSSRTYLF